MLRTKSAVQFEHPAKGPHHCSQCRHFIGAEHACELVQGRVQKGDWCKLFTPRTSAQRQAKAA